MNFKIVPYLWKKTSQQIKNTQIKDCYNKQKVLQVTIKSKKTIR
jgi:hypothetical protein